MTQFNIYESEYINKLNVNRTKGGHNIWNDTVTDWVKYNGVISLNQTQQQQQQSVCLMTLNQSKLVCIFCDKTWVI